MKKTTESKEDLVQNELGQDENGDDYNESDNEKDNCSETILTPLEKKFLLCAERGDCATVRRYML